MVKDNGWNAAAGRTPDNSMGKDAFLQLLITQMKYQDPLNPMDDRDFLGQMAQFTALEQMQNLNATFAKTQAYSMIGKTIDATYRNPVTGDFENVFGFVDAVTTKGSEVYLIVDGKEVPLSSVNVVGDDYLTTLQLNDILDHVSNTRNQAYVGKWVQAFLTNDNGDVTEYVEGKVDYVRTNSGKPILVIGNKEVLPSEVVSISDKPFLLGKTIGVTSPDDQRTISGIKIVAGKPELTFTNGTSVKIERVNHIMEALNYAETNRHIEHGTVSGTVQSVFIRMETPYLLVKDSKTGELKEVQYTDFKGL
jgi:flagellar basal-body rod modification protein FlgD